MALLLSNGDWDGASAQLAAQAEQATMAASVADSGRAAGPAVGVVGPALTAAGSDDPELAAALAASTSAAALAYNISRQAAAAAAAAREEADLAAAIRASEEEARRQQAAHALPWAQQSSAAGTTYGGRLVQAEWGAQQTAQQQQPHGWYAPADKDGMPEFAGGWDAGPAAVAAASGRTSAASALPPAPDPWQQPPAPLSAGLPGSSLGRISALSVQDSATAAAPAGPWASIPAVHDYGALPAITSGIGGLAAAAAGSGLASLQPKSADLAAAVAAAQPEAQGVATVTANWDAPKALAGGFAPATPALQQQPPPASEEELDSLMALLGVS